MGTILADNVSLERLDQLLRRENLRLAWRPRFSNLFSNRLTSPQPARLHAKDLPAFDLSYDGKAAKE